MTQRTAILIAALSLLVVIALQDAKQRGIAEGRAEAAAQQVREVERLVVMRDTLYVRDTIRLTRWRERWDSVRVTDTLVLHDIVYVPRDAADSVISACYAVVRSCEARVAARDSLIVTLQEVIKAERDKRPSALRVWAERALWLGAGVGVGAVVAR